MHARRLVTVLVLATVFAGGMVLGSFVQPWGIVNAQAAKRVYELRTYTAPDGRLGDLQARFRNHTVKLFEKHGITSIGYFVPQDAPQSQNTLIYVLAHKDRESAKQNWAAFQKDPEWQSVFKESQKNGPLQTQVQSVFMDPLDFSQLK
jgi:NIPSNAP protein